MEAFRIGSQGFGFTVFVEPGHCYNIISTSTLLGWEPSSLRFMMKGVREDVLWQPVVNQGVRRFLQVRQIE
jgi:hypothetical protein